MYCRCLSFVLDSLVSYLKKSGIWEVPDAKIIIDWSRKQSMPPLKTGQKITEIVVM